MTSRPVDLERVLDAQAVHQAWEQQLDLCAMEVAVVALDPRATVYDLAAAEERYDRAAAQAQAAEDRFRDLRARWDAVRLRGASYG